MLKTKRTRKPYEKMTKKELYETVEELVQDFDIYQCSKCGEFNDCGDICWTCGWDYSDGKVRTL